jgi:hypothetical protein
MSSMFTWVDFAEDDRRKMADVIALFAEKDTRDELGLGGVRDTFADLLFPATSTIQTRARPAQTQGLGLRDRQAINDAQGAHRCGSPARPRPTSGGSCSRSAENYCSQRA